MLVRNFIVTHVSIYVYVLDADSAEFCRQAGCSDPRLQRKASELPSLFQHSRAPATLACYGLAYKKWRIWTEQFSEVRPLPANEIHIVLYLNDLGKKGLSYHVIVQAVAAIKWAHSLAGLGSPTDAIIVKEAVTSLKRKLARKTIRKEPVGLAHIQELMDTTLRDNITDSRNVNLMVIAFFALLRSDEIRHIQKQEIAFQIILHENVYTNV